MDVTFPTFLAMDIPKMLTHFRQRLMFQGGKTIRDRQTKSADSMVKARNGMIIKKCMLVATIIIAGLKERCINCKEITLILS